MRRPKARLRWTVEYEEAGELAAYDETNTIIVLRIWMNRVGFCRKCSSFTLPSCSAAWARR